MSDMDRNIELIRYAIQAAEITQRDEAWEAFNDVLSEIERLQEAGQAFLMIFNAIGAVPVIHEGGAEAVAQNIIDAVLRDRTDLAEAEALLRGLYDHLNETVDGRWDLLDDVADWLARRKGE